MNAKSGDRLGAKGIYDLYVLVEEHGEGPHDNDQDNKS